MAEVYYNTSVSAFGRTAAAREIEVGRFPATVFAENAGVVGLLMSILVWVSSYTAYL